MKQHVRTCSSLCAAKLSWQYNTRSNHSLILDTICIYTTFRKHDSPIQQQWYTLPLLRNRLFLSTPVQQFKCTDCLTHASLSLSLGKSRITHTHAPTLNRDYVHTMWPQLAALQMGVSCKPRSQKRSEGDGLVSALGSSRRSTQSRMTGTRRLVWCGGVRDRKSSTHK